MTDGCFLVPVALSLRMAEAEAVLNGALRGGRQLSPAQSGDFIAAEQAKMAPLRGGDRRSV